MAALIALWVKATGTPMTCASLEALAQQYTCIDRALQLPALIGLAVTMQPGSGGGGGPTQVFQFTSNGLGGAPPFSPVLGPSSVSGVSTGAIAIDYSTGEQFQWLNGAWA
jgi:hypothetical protein